MGKVAPVHSAELVLLPLLLAQLPSSDMTHLGLLTLPNSRSRLALQGLRNLVCVPVTSDRLGFTFLLAMAGKRLARMWGWLLLTLVLATDTRVVQVWIRLLGNRGLFLLVRACSVIRPTLR